MVALDGLEQLGYDADWQKSIVAQFSRRVEKVSLFRAHQLLSLLGNI